MADNNLKILVSQGLQALKAGGDVAKHATAEIQQDANDHRLVSALQAGNRTAEQWQQRVERALAESGGGEDQGNPVLEAHFDVSRKIRQMAPDAKSRDLGIIAAGQLALHYWIAAFGTLRTYAQKLGLTETEQGLSHSLEEAKQADQAHTQLAPSSRAERLHGGRPKRPPALCRLIVSDLVARWRCRPQPAALAQQLLPERDPSCNQAAPRT